MGLLVELLMWRSNLLTLMLRFLHCRQERDGGPQYTMALIPHEFDKDRKLGLKHVVA
jgi:hypothetical protein